MELLFERHQEYLSDVPNVLFRELYHHIDWTSRLIIIKGPKGVGKSTLMKQFINGHYKKDDTHVLYCSADSSYFSAHSLVDTASNFAKKGGTHLFIDEIHKYRGWSREVKEIYDLYGKLKLVLSGSSLIQLNDGQADLSRRADVYDMAGLSFREYLWFEKGLLIKPITLTELLKFPNEYCSAIKTICRPLEFFSEYLKSGYYPFSFEKRGRFHTALDAVINYTIETELTGFRKLKSENASKIKALLQLLSSMVPYQVDISKLSAAIGADRITTLKYLKILDEAKLIRRLFCELDKITDLQKPEKVLLDNTNLMYCLSDKGVETGTARECFFCNQLSSAGHKVEYGGMKSGDFRINGDIVIEVGGEGKGLSQFEKSDKENGFRAVDNIDTAGYKKIPLWAFGCLY